MSRPAADGPGCALPGAAPGLAYSLTFLAFLAHNIAELVSGLPGWAALRGVPVTPGQYANAVLGLTLVAAVLLLLGRTLPFTRPVQIAVAAGAGALIANAGSHLAGSLATRSVMPGLATALVLVLPGATWLIARLPLPRRTKVFAGLAGAAAMPLLAGAALRLAG